MFPYGLTLSLIFFMLKYPLVDLIGTCIKYGKTPKRNMLANSREVCLFFFFWNGIIPYLNSREKSCKLG